jgi:hypothetical protein
VAVAVKKEEMDKEENFNKWYIAVIAALAIEVILFYLFTQYFS